MVEEHIRMEQEIIMQVCILKQPNKSHQNLANSHSFIAQKGDLMICLVTEWLRRQKDEHCILDQFLKNHIPNAE